MPVEGPRIGVLDLGALDRPDDGLREGESSPETAWKSAGPGLCEGVREAGGRPYLRSPGKRFPKGGVALGREWTADRVHADFVSLSDAVGGLDGLLVGAKKAEDLAALVIAALRLDLPAVVVPSGDGPFDTVPYALGLAPLGAKPAEVAVRISRSGEPRPGQLVSSFLLANALRAGLALGAGPELLVHLAAVAREAGATGFPRMARVLVPESPQVTGPGSSWFETYGVAGLFARLGDGLHDAPTVAGRLKENLPDEPPAPEPADGSRLRFVQGRASGTEAVYRTSGPETEVSGECRVFSSEEAAVRAVEEGGVGPGALLVVAGCGPRGGPGLIRLDALGGALRDAGLAGSVPVLTDGLAPEGAAGFWASLFTPEAVSGGVIGLLRDGDTLRFDLAEGRIRTTVAAQELARREPFEGSHHPTPGYAARYARVALPALEGAGFS